MLFLVVFFVGSVDDSCSPRWKLGSHFVSPDELEKALPQAILFFFLLSFLHLVALCVSLWGGGVPHAAFSLPPASVACLSSGLVGSPCRVFPCVFSVVLGSPAISCILRLSPCRLR